MNPEHPRIPVPQTVFDLSLSRRLRNGIVLLALLVHSVIGNPRASEGEKDDLEALRAGDIIHQLKDLARKRSSKRTECDINFLIRDLERLASVDTRLHNVKLDLQLSERLPMVLADGIHIQQVLLNLIRNGVDAIVDGDSDKREIVIQTGSRDDDMVEISVADTGCGLPSDCDEELFPTLLTS